MSSNKTLSAQAMEVFESIMEATPDVLEALAEYVQLPRGVYRVSLKLSTTPVFLKDPDIPYNRAEYVINEVLDIEQEIDELDVPKVGSICSELFDLTSSVGQGMLRRRLEFFKLLTGKGPEVSNRDTLESANDMEAILITGPRRKAKDSEDLYTSIKQLVRPEDLMAK